MPEPRPRVVVTFDNLGEAAEEDNGTWPADQPVGRHPSVTDGLPAALGLLGRVGVRATFFVEGVNAERYPEALRSIADAGHEVGYHGWRHERWADQDAGRQGDILDRGLDAFRSLGIRPSGFRPPGGALPAGSVPRLAERGFAYASPDAASADAALAAELGTGEIDLLPFEWPHIDAYAFYEPFASLRERYGDPPGLLDPALFADRLVSLIDEAARGRMAPGPLVLLFHPFLLVEPVHRAVLERTLARLAWWRDQGRLEVLTCDEAARQRAA